MSRTFLLEIGTEELPAGVVPGALQQLQEMAEAELAKARISYGRARTLGTPRRLGLVVEGVAERQSTAEEQVKGPSARVAFDADGRPTPAAVGFARKQGVDVGSLERRATAQGDYVFAVRMEEGRPTADVLADALPVWVRALQFPATMRWGSGETRFSRPIRWLVTLFGNDVVAWEFGGLTAGRTTRGRRFSGIDETDIPAADAYEETLRTAHVEADHAARRAHVWSAVERAAADVGGVPQPDADLLDEVTFLVEQAGVVCGNVKEGYLTLPTPVIVTPMKEHQRYFPVLDRDGNLLPHFVTVTNGDHGDRELIRKGNEKVLDARLSDARFFFEEDLKTALSDRVEALRAVLFQERLGNLFDKTARVGALVQRLGKEADAADETVRLAERAARLCKADLVTNMVGEFPELQGVMGKEYALRSGEDGRVADAILEHLLPRGANDELPRSVEGVLVALADKLDTLVGCFGAGLIPTGSQDPYALRRQALGVIRILLSDVGRSLHLSLDWAIDTALGQYDRPADDSTWAQAPGRLHDFFEQRLRGVLHDMGTAHDAVEAVLSGRPIGEAADVVNRVETLERMRAAGEFSDVVALFQRAANLVDRQEDGVAEAVDAARFEDDAERALHAAVREAGRDVRPLYDGRDYEAALRRLAALRPSVDAFFDSVLVMAPNAELRRNRLALLGELVRVAEPLADFRKIDAVSAS